MANGIIIDVGFSSKDLESYIEKIKKEFETVDFGDAIGLEESFKEQAKYVRAELDKLEKEIKSSIGGKTVEGFQSQLKTLTTTVNGLVGTVREIGKSMPNNKNLQGMINDMTLLSSEAENVSRAVKDIEKTANKSNITISNNDDLETTLFLLKEIEKESKKKSKDKLLDIDQGNSNEEYLINLKKELINTKKEFVKLNDEYSKMDNTSSNESLRIQKDIVEKGKYLSAIIDEFKEIFGKSFSNSAYGQIANGLAEPLKIVDDILNKVKSSITEINNEIENTKKTTNTKVVKNVSNSVSNNLSKEKRGQIQVPLRISDNSKDDLYQKAISIIQYVQENVDKTPLTVKVAFISDFLTKRNSEILEQISGSLDKVNDSELKTQLSDLVNDLNKQLGKQLHMRIEVEGAQETQKQMRTLVKELQQEFENADFTVYPHAKLKDEEKANLAAEINSLSDGIKLNIGIATEDGVNSDRKSILKEINILNILNNKIKTITDSVNNKTQAFLDEEEFVESSVGNETERLNQLYSELLLITDELMTEKELFKKGIVLNYNIDNTAFVDLSNVIKEIQESLKSLSYAISNMDFSNFNTIPNLKPENITSDKNVKKEIGHIEQLKEKRRELAELSDIAYEIGDMDEYKRIETERQKYGEELKEIQNANEKNVESTNKVNTAINDNISSNKVYVETVKRGSGEIISELKDVYEHLNAVRKMQDKVTESAVKSSKSFEKRKPNSEDDEVEFTDTQKYKMKKAGMSADLLKSREELSKQYRQLYEKANPAEKVLYKDYFISSLSKNKTGDARNQLKDAYKEFKKYADDQVKLNSVEGAAAGYAYLSAYEEAIKQGVSDFWLKDKYLIPNVNQGDKIKFKVALENSLRKSLPTLKNESVYSDDDIVFETNAIVKENKALEERKNIQKEINSNDLPKLINESNLPQLKNENEKLSEQEKILHDIRNLWDEIQKHKDRSGKLISTSKTSGNQLRLSNLASKLHELKQSGGSIDLGMSDRERDIVKGFYNIPVNPQVEDKQKTQKQIVNDSTPKEPIKVKTELTDFPKLVNDEAKLSSNENGLSSGGTTAPLQQVEDKLEDVEQQAKETTIAIDEAYRSINRSDADFYGRKYGGKTFFAASEELANLYRKGESGLSDDGKTYKSSLLLANPLEFNANGVWWDNIDLPDQLKPYMDQTIYEYQQLLNLFLSNLNSEGKEYQNLFNEIINKTLLTETDDFDGKHFNFTRIFDDMNGEQYTIQIESFEEYVESLLPLLKLNDKIDIDKFKELLLKFYTINKGLAKNALRIDLGNIISNRANSTRDGFIVNDLLSLYDENDDRIKPRYKTGQIANISEMAGYNSAIIRNIKDGDSDTTSDIFITFAKEQIQYYEEIDHSLDAITRKYNNVEMAIGSLRDFPEDAMLGIKSVDDMLNSEIDEYITSLGEAHRNTNTFIEDAKRAGIDIPQSFLGLASEELWDINDTSIQKDLEEYKNKLIKYAEDIRSEYSALQSNKSDILSGTTTPFPILVDEHNTQELSKQEQLLEEINSLWTQISSNRTGKTNRSAINEKEEIENLTLLAQKLHELKDLGGKANLEYTNKNDKNIISKYYNNQFFVSNTESLGQDAVDGYKLGLIDKIPEVEATVKQVIKAGLDAAAKAQDSNSPAEEYRKLGHDAMDGYILGIKDKAEEVQKAISDIITGGLIKTKSKEKDVSNLSNLANTIRQLINSLSGDKSKENIQKLIDNINLLSQSLNGIKFGKNSTLLNQINEIIQKSKELNDLAKIVSAGQKALSSTNDKTSNKSDKDLTNKYQQLETILKRIVQLTKDYNKESNVNNRSEIKSQIDEYTNQADNLQLEIWGYSKLNEAKQTGIDLLRDTIDLESKKGINRDLSNVKKQEETAEKLNAELQYQREILNADSSEWAWALELLSQYKNSLGDIVKIERKIKKDESTGFQRISYKFTDSNNNSQVVGASGESLIRTDKVMDLDKAYKELSRSINAYYSAQNKINKGDDSEYILQKSINAYNKIIEMQKIIAYWREKGISPSEDQLAIEKNLVAVESQLEEQIKTSGVINLYKTVYTTINDLNKSQKELNNFKLKANGTDEYKETIEELQNDVSILIGTLRTYKLGDFFTFETLSSFDLDANQSIIDPNNLDKLILLNKNLPFTEEQIKNINQALLKNTQIRESNNAAISKVNDVQAEKERNEQIKMAEENLKMIERSYERQYALQAQIISLDDGKHVNQVKELNDQYVLELQNCDALIAGYKTYSNVIDDVDSKLEEVRNQAQNVGINKLGISQSKVNDVQAEKERNEQYIELLNTIERYSIVKKRIASEKMLDGDIEEADNLKKNIDEIRKTDILSSEQVNNSIKLLDNLNVELKDIEKTTIGLNIDRFEHDVKLLKGSLKAAFNGNDTAKMDFQKTFGELLVIYNNLKSKMQDGLISDDEIVRLKDYFLTFKGILISSVNEIDPSTMVDEFKVKFKELLSLIAQIDSISIDDIFDGDNVNLIDEFIQKIRIIYDDLDDKSKKLAKKTAIDKPLNRIAKRLTEDTGMAKDLYKSYEDLFKRIESMGDNIPVETLAKFNEELMDLEVRFQKTGKKGLKFWDDIFKGIKTKSRDIIARYLSLQDIIRYTKQIFDSIKTLDTALVDLRKTTSMSTSELDDFYYSSNKVAKQMGVTTASIIEQAAAWSRLGYSTKEQVETMSKLSSQFASISPGVDTTTAQEGLVSAMKGFGIEVDNVQREIMDNINKIGNTMATSNGDIINMLERSSAAMRAANNDIRETIALESAAVEITQNAESTGTAFRTISMRLRGYSEDSEDGLEELDDSLQNISGDIADLTKVNGKGGVTIFTDETKETYKSTYQILKDISEVWKDLTDAQQAGLLEKLGGKRGGQVIAGILQDFDRVDYALKAMEGATGSADAEMEIIRDSFNYKLNELKETWVGTFQEILDRDEVKRVIDSLTKSSEKLIKPLSGFAPILENISNVAQLLVTVFSSLTRVFGKLTPYLTLSGIIVKKNFGNRIVLNMPLIPKNIYSRAGVIGLVNQ